MVVYLSLFLLSSLCCLHFFFFFFFFNDTATTEIYTLSLHDALPISRNTPKVIGGITETCRRVAVAIYGPAIERLVPVSSTEAAELVKILENTFRSVNIGLVNEMAIVCEKLGVNVWEVIDAAATKPFGFMKFTPGPGVGGHCIPLDPHYLAWKMRTLNYRTRFIELAGEINAAMPEY